MEYKSIDKLKEAIDDYLKSMEITSCIININNIEVYKELKDYLTSLLHTERVSSGKSGDQLPDIIGLFGVLRIVDKNTVVIGMSEHLRFCEEHEASAHLSNMLGIICHNSKKIFLMYNFERKLKTAISINPRIDRQIYSLSKDTSITDNQIVLISRSIGSIRSKNIIDGYLTYLRDFELDNITNACVISEITDVSHVRLLPNVAIINNSYDYLREFCGLPDNLTPSYGEIKQWNSLVSELEDQSFGDYCKSEFGYDNDLKLNDWNDYDEFKKWCFWLKLKCNNGGKKYIDSVARQSISYKAFAAEYYLYILNIPYRSVDFDNLYKERKRRLKAMYDVSIISDFCDCAKAKGPESIYYLTDTSVEECEEIIIWTSKQGDISQKVLSILKNVYPALTSYLAAHNFHNELLDDYFTDYKKQKLLNKISDDFFAKVESNAKARSYNLIQSRSSVLEKVDKQNARIFFIDALGLEFISYIAATCATMGLTLNVNVARSNIPTTTENNKDFTYDVPYRKLDDVKHEGTGRYSYGATKPAIHLVEELRIIHKVLEDVCNELRQYPKIILISDHGASRLVVLNNKQKIYQDYPDVELRGRCCRYDESLPKIEYATKEDGYYVLANYDKFSVRGAPPRVETHGGATLEEVLVPIIEISRSNGKPNVCCITPEINTNAGQKIMRLVIYISLHFENIQLKIEGKFYSDCRFDGEYWNCNIPVLKATVHTAEIYYKDNLLGVIEFNIVKSSKEKQFDF